MFNPRDPKSMEKYSSAVSLSDMEVFIFPELIYALTLANIMSPQLWSWRNDSWFKDMKKLNEYRRIQRLKQFIMDNFTFNLDLETWGLTTKPQELARFSDFIDTSILAQSNALFGYEGDKYYFDIDIRRHFGLDNYTSEIIPYWKTETIEAMSAFRYKEGYSMGAGECVSLATLYAAALFVVAEIPLENIFLMATPLHSQNFVLVRDGVITNNRRIVTKNMWFNGTELSAKARRALQHERITVVANNSGYVHIMYPEATIDPQHYQRFGEALHEYLTTDVTYEIIANFLRERSPLQHCFQFEHSCCGKPRYIQAEKLYAYEHGSKSRVGDETQENLIHEIDEDEFYPTPLPNRIVLNEIEAYFKSKPIPVNNDATIEELKGYLRHSCFNVEEVVSDLLAFCSIKPNLPQTDKQWAASQPLLIERGMSREQIVDYLQSMRATSETADLAFTAYRDLACSPWKPFLKAAFQRNPVSRQKGLELGAQQSYEHLRAMESASIYDSTRLAQPDEVWNFGRGDGLEKALCLMNILWANSAAGSISLEQRGSAVVVRTSGGDYAFESKKGVQLPRAEDFDF